MEEFVDLVDENGKEIDMPGFTARPVPPDVLTKVVYSGILNKGLLKAAIKDGASYLPMEAAYTGHAGEVHVIPYKADMRAAIATPLNEEIAKQMIESLVDRDVQVDSIKMRIIREPYSIKDISIEIYRRERLIIRALAKLNVDVFIEFVGARLAAVGRSA